MKTKKKIVTAIISVMLLSVVLAGCGNSGTDNQTPVPTDKPGPSSESPSASPNQGITVNDIKFEIIDINSLDEEHIKLINDYSLSRGFTYWVDTDGTYTVFIGLGEKPTSGYDVNVLSVEDNEGKTNITVEITEPAKDEMVAQVITYPYTIIRMKGITDNFNITDTKSNRFEFLYGENLKKHMVVCVYGGLSDNNSIEATLDGSPVFFRNTDMASLVEGLDPGALVNVVYIVNDEGQNILESINPVTGEYSETLTAKGTYQGLIDGNSIEVLVEGAYMALRNTEVETMTEGLEKDDPVKITYTMSEQGQFLLVGISVYE